MLYLSSNIGLSPSPSPSPALRIEGVTKIVLVVLSLFGFFTFDSVYLFSVLNYVAQAEMNVHLLRDLRQLLLSKKYDDVDGAMKVCHTCGPYIDEVFLLLACMYMYMCMHVANCKEV